jgi:quinol-cytochrome oxidoreductase complex cytochrome b subunit
MDDRDSMDQKTSILDWLSARLNLTEIFSLLTSYGLFYAELDSSKGLRRALAEAFERPTASASRWPRTLGLLVVALMGLLMLTGGLLSLYYLPTPEAAHESVGTILRDVHFGALVHQVHFWGAQVLIAVLILRLVRFFVQNVHKPPRELLWVFAGALLLVVLHSDLTGRLLPWSGDGYWSTVRAIEIAQSVPIYGTILVFLIGGAESIISDLTLIRFYILHIAVLPGVAITLIYLHFSCIRRTGFTEKKDETKLPGRTAFKVNFVNMVILLTAAFAVLLSFAIVVAEPFEAEADPFDTVPGIGPPWYLLAPFAVLELGGTFLPRWIPGIFLFLLTMSVLSLPFWYQPKEEGRPRSLSYVIGALAVAVWLLLTWYGAQVR